MKVPVSAVQAVSSLAGMVTQSNPAVGLLGAFGVAMFAGMYILDDLFSEEEKRTQRAESRDLFVKHLPPSAEVMVVEQPTPVQPEAPAPAPVAAPNDLASHFLSVVR